MHHNIFLGWMAVAVLGVALLGCDGSGGATRVADDPKLKAQLLWDNRCAACHGAEGHGNGPAVPGLRAQPRDLTHPMWHKSVTDERIHTVILEGGPAVGLSHVMSPNPDLEDDPATVAELVQLVRSLKRENP
ncbi:MAG: c-type cytochrome [Myxococcota bacterium]